jgi:hypothetical protein
MSDYLDGFLHHNKADELVTACQTPRIESRLRSVTCSPRRCRPPLPDPWQSWRRGPGAGTIRVKAAYARGCLSALAGLRLRGSRR